MSEGYLIYLITILLALTNTLWSRYQLNKEKQTTLVIVTHDLLLAQKCEQQIRLHRGEIAEQRFGQTLTQTGSIPSIPV